MACPCRAGPWQEGGQAGAAVPPLAQQRALGPCTPGPPPAGVRSAAEFPQRGPSSALPAPGQRHGWSPRQPNTSWENHKATASAWHRPSQHTPACDTEYAEPQIRNSWIDGWNCFGFRQFNITKHKIQWLFPLIHMEIFLALRRNDLCSAGCYSQV